MCSVCVDVVDAVCAVVMCRVRVVIACARGVSCAVRASVMCRARVGAAVSAGVLLSIIVAFRARLLVGSSVASLLLGALTNALAAAAAIPIGSAVRRSRLRSERRRGSVLVCGLVRRKRRDSVHCAGFTAKGCYCMRRARCLPRRGSSSFRQKRRCRSGTSGGCFVRLKINK